MLHERAAPGSTRQDPSTVVLERACIRQAANELPEAPTWPDDVRLKCASSVPVGVLVCVRLGQQRISID